MEKEQTMLDAKTPRKRVRMETELATHRELVRQASGSRKPI